MKNRKPFRLLAIACICITTISLISCTKGGGNTENLMPLAVINVDTNRAIISTLIQFDGSQSTDKEDPVTSLQTAWNFGDSVAAYSPYTINKTTSHAFKSKGVYYVNMVMKDTKGLADTATKMIMIVDNLSNLPPSNLIYTAPGNWAIWLATTVTLTWSCTDPENDLLTFDLYYEIEAAEPQLRFAGITGQEYTLTNLRKGVTYNWRIGVRDQNGNYVLGDVWRFSTQP